MNLDRRDFFKFAAGSAVGLTLSPVPWTLLNDSSKWSQNWSWIPRLQRGEMRTKFTTCTLCPAGCGVKARCLGEQPVSLAGAAAHPVSRGALCPVGLAAHQQPYHPLRLRQALCHGNAVPMEEAVAAVKAAIARSAGTIAVWDPAPGRARSAMYRRFAEKAAHGVYLTSSPPEDAMLRALAGMFEKPVGPLGIDLERARTVLSFGAPVLDGWGTPGRVLRQRPNFRLLQVEAELSRTASLADSWLAIRPGTETVLALGLAHALTRQGLVDPAVVDRAIDYHEFLEMTAAYTPESVAATSGISSDKISETARELAQGGPVVVIAASASLPAAGLNFLFGGAGRTIVERGGLAPQSNSSPEETEDGSIHVLIAAGGVPWERFEKKLAPGAVVVSLAPWNDRRANFAIPAPVAVESTVDVPAPFDARTDMLSVAAPLVTPPPGVIDPAEFLARVEPSLGTVENALNARIAALHRLRRGSVISYQDGSTTPLVEIGSPGDLRKLLLAGAVWVDAAPASNSFPSFSLTGLWRRHSCLPGRDSSRPSGGGPGKSAEMSLGAADTSVCATSASGWRAVHGLAVSPILSKLYQESGLRDRREA